MLFGRRPIGKADLVAAGDRARGRGRVSKAIGLYRRALAEAPDDATVHGKLAPLLARRRKKAEALASFAKAAASQSRAGFTDRALSVVLQAADFYPEEAPLWDELARLYLARGRRPDAVAALAQGGRRLLKLRHLDVAERVLRRALELEPWHPTSADLLARTLSRAGRKREALALLDGLGSRVRGATLRRTRGLAFRISPTPANLWRWLGAVFSQNS